MAEINSLIQWLLLILPLAVVARVLYCLCVLPTDTDRAQELKRRIRNALIFLVLAETIVGFLAMITDYFIV